MTYYVLHFTYILRITFNILHDMHITYYILHFTYYIWHITYYILHMTYYILHMMYHTFPTTSYIYIHIYLYVYTYMFTYTCTHTCARAQALHTPPKTKQTPKWLTSCTKWTCIPGLVQRHRGDVASAPTSQAGLSSFELQDLCRI